MGDGPARAESAQFTLPERYQLIRPLKSHPNSRLTGQQTLLAMDLIDERRVIIQALPTRSLSDDGRFRFQQHLRATSRIRNSFFLEPTDWQPDGNYLYRARRYVRAMSLEQLMRRAKSNGVRGPLLPLDQCVQFTRGLLETLREIHSVDCVRQDFRLSQILIHGNQPRLIAAGPDLFVAPQQRNERWSLAFSTVASPELSGLIEHDIDSASDLYSIGVVLFCLLAGHPPFEGQKLGEVLCQHLTNVPDLSLISHAPEALVRIIERLLAKQPQDRYQSASAVLHDLDQVEKIENGQLDASEFVLGRSDRRETIIDSAFVGRRKELRAIENSITEVRAGQCQTMIVQSDSGIGKTRLIVESLRYASAAGLSVYRGCASSQASQKPAAALISVFQQIIPQTHLHSQLRADLQEYRAEITIALPEMARAIGWETETPDQHRWGDALDSFGLNRINQAYCKILNSIASPESPALVWIDDCQWLDPQTIEVLSELRRRSPAYTMIMLSSRTDGSENLSLFEALEPTRVISLGPLADVDVQAMIESMAGHLPLEAIRTIVGLAAGNPFMAAGVLRGMVETGALVFGNMAGQRRWTIDPHRMTDIQASSDSADALMKRLDHVSDAVLELLSTAAVIGKEFRLTTLGQLLDQSAEDTAEHLSWCREKRLVWRQPDGSYAFVHDRIQETLIGRLPDDRRMSLHLRYGEYLLSKHNSDDHTLAYHFNEAGRSGRALPYALRAAKSARQSYSLEAAIQSLRIAVRGIGLGDQDTFRSVAIDLAEALKGSITRPISGSKKRRSSRPASRIWLGSTCNVAS
jgi:two-component system sensor kinase